MPVSSTEESLEMTPAIRVAGLGKCFRTYRAPGDRLLQSLFGSSRRKYYREFWALRNISFEVQPGEAVALIGCNGSGKSTLLQILTGILGHDEGTYSVNGRVAALLELGSGFNPEFTGRENVFMNAAILGISRDEITRRLDEIIAFADIGDYIEQPVRSYSSGMVVRLAFAVSICIRPEILIVDEALSVGDMGFQMKCMERVDELLKAGTTLLFVSHDTNLVKAFCNKAIYLAAGKIQAVGQAAEIVERYLMEIRDSQRRNAAESSRVVAKPVLGSGPQALAFGTQEGWISSALFAETQSKVSAFSTGEKVRIQVEVKYDRMLTHPAVSLIITDPRMLEIAGKTFFLEHPPRDLVAQQCTAKLIWSFDAELNVGHYYITVRLETRPSEGMFFPIDKQVAALSFQVIRSAKYPHFIGAFNLPMECIANYSGGNPVNE